MNAEQQRLEDASAGRGRWKRWGPYVSDRQWGTVREDYSADGDAWNYFPFEQASARAYRWGEDWLAAVCDESQHFCLGLGLWNGHDPILKERLFGLTNRQGNHGEDVKELYWHLDATPTSSYLKFLYKYPHAAFPYRLLIDENARRGKQDLEYELLDTGLFAGDAYFDVLVEYAKAGPEDVLMRVTVTNRGPSAPLDVLIQGWFRNTWSWKAGSQRPRLDAVDTSAVKAHHAKLGDRWLYFDGADLLFCDNDSNLPTLFGVEGVTGYFKDGVNRCIVNGDRSAVNSFRAGTKVAGHWHSDLEHGGSAVLTARWSNTANATPFADFDDVFSKRIAEADAYYADLQAGQPDADTRLVQRQALAGLLWSKQFYYYDIPEWLEGDSAQPTPPPQRLHARNSDWRHLNNADIVSMPDKWEYPWYAAWDLAFHMVPLSLVDVDFAKSQLVLFLREWYLHPNGQIPAYEWNLSDVNPPVHAWATWRVYQMERRQRGKGDLAFLERIFHKLLLNFTWWVNRKDSAGRNLFQGGFLGLDNIGVFNRSVTLPSGVTLDQADATSWMAMYCLNLLRIALELAVHNPVYEDIATKFLEHFLSIAEAMTHMGDPHSKLDLWDEEDQFYYDHLNVADGAAGPFGAMGGVVPMRVRSIVGLIPIFAVETLEPEMVKALPGFARRLNWYLNYRPDLASLVSRWDEPGRGERRLLSLLRGHRLKCLLRRALDEDEFLSPYGIRSLSKAHQAHPYSINFDSHKLTVAYVPGESDSDMFGGNSNWRGPIWLPINFLLIESLRKFHHYYDDDFRVECPTRSGNYLSLSDIADELSRRLARLFTKNEHGERPVYGSDAKLQRDPHFQDMIWFAEHFHGDTGRGLGAMHQTGWTAVIASLLATPERAAVCG